MLSIGSPRSASASLAGELRRHGLPGPLLWLVGLFLVGVISRWATRSLLVQSWDAGNFVKRAAALREKYRTQASRAVTGGAWSLLWWTLIL